MEVTFTGPTIRWIAPDSTNHGTADVYVDGVKKATVDSYAPSATFQQVKYEANDLGPGEHTLAVVVTGQKGTAASQGTFISVDAFDTHPTVTPPPPPSPTAYPRVPQEGPGIAVQGRDATTLLADYRFGPHRLVYSTSQLLTTLAKAPRDAVVLDGAEGTAGETVLRYAGRPEVQQLSGPKVAATWDSARGDLRLNYTHGGTSVVRLSGGDAPDLLVVLTGRKTVRSTWRLDAGNAGVLALGPDLVRTARLPRGDTLALTGDTAAATTATVLAPPGVQRVTWNGQPVSVRRDSAGALVLALPGPAPTGAATMSAWRSMASDPEREPSYDDSDWRVADLKASENPRHVAGAQAGVVLDAEEYGFHEGDVWYRGRFTPGTAADSASVAVGTGTAGVALAWLDGTYLGSVGDGTYRLPIPAGALQPGKPAQLSVLVRNMGQYEDWSADGRSKGGRGLVDVAIDGAGAWQWRLQGAAGGDHPVDAARGLYNNGGLFGERQGWHLPGAPDSTWPATSSLKSERPGVSFYRATVSVPHGNGNDTAWAVRFDDDSDRSARYRVLVFVNGWNTGQYVHNVGPQREFVIPSGFLRPGENTVALAVTAEQAGVGPDSVTVVNRWTVAGGVGGLPNEAPDWADRTGS
ncbi:hypothetical protein GCM10027517_35810 [Phycicoccus ginsengisoli]